jgi:8-oxo-dGTP pyrophosphatase MutT (NUDIX family)
MTVEFITDPGASAPAPRDAATVLVLREGAAGPEVFLLRRNADARFMGGAYVFPGGRVDPGDADPNLPCELTPAEAAARLREDDPARALALHVAAIRECVEESGILLASGAVSDADRAALRAALAVRDAPPLGALLPPGVRLRPQELSPFARWITPAQESRRFDARFFLARAPSSAGDARHDGRETVASAWMSPRLAIDRALRGEIVLAPPTWRALAEVADARSVEDAFDPARARLAPREPAVRFDDGEVVVVLPDDPQHPQFVRVPAHELPTRFRYLQGSWLPVAAT